MYLSLTYKYCKKNGEYTKSGAAKGIYYLSETEATEECVGYLVVSLRMQKSRR